MVDLGQKKVELSTFFYAHFFQIIKKAAGITGSSGHNQKPLQVFLFMLCVSF